MQCQGTRALIPLRVSVPTFLIQKICETVDCWGTLPKSQVLSENSILGVPAWEKEQANKTTDIKKKQSLTLNLPPKLFDRIITETIILSIVFCERSYLILEINP